MKLRTKLDTEKNIQFQVDDTSKYELGRGQSAIVYLATQIVGGDKGRLVAMKVLNPQASSGNTPSGQSIEDAFRDGLVGQDGIKVRFAGSDNLVKPLHVLAMEGGGICSITDYYSGRDVGLLIDIMNDIKGIMSSTTPKTKLQYDSSISPSTPANFNLEKWQPIAYTIAIAILNDLVSIHETGNGRSAHKDFRPSNIVIDGINVGNQSDKDRATIESILDIDPSVLRILANDIDFNDPAKYSMPLPGQGITKKESFLRSYENENPDKRRNPLRSNEDYRLRRGATCYIGSGLTEDQASDVHATGFIIIELLTGMLPDTFKNYRDDREMSTQEALRSIKGDQLEKNITKIIAEMTTPKKTARQYRDALIKALDDTNLRVITEEKVKTDKEKALRRNFPVVVRPYHVFMKQVEEWETELSALEHRLPQPNDLYNGLLSLELYKREIELEDSASGKLGLNRLGITRPKEVEDHKKTLETAVSKSYGFLRKEPISFTPQEDINQLYDSCWGDETADKEGITQRFESIMVKYNAVSRKYTLLIDKMDEVVASSQSAAEEIARGYEQIQGNATEIRSKMKEHQGYITQRLAQLKKTTE